MLYCIQLSLIFDVGLKKKNSLHWFYNFRCKFNNENSEHSTPGRGCAQHKTNWDSHLWQQRNDQTTEKYNCIIKVPLSKSEPQNSSYSVERLFFWSLTKFLHFTLMQKIFQHMKPFKSSYFVILLRIFVNLLFFFYPNSDISISLWHIISCCITYLKKKNTSVHMHYILTIWHI